MDGSHVKSAIKHTICISVTQVSNIIKKILISIPDISLHSIQIWIGINQISREQF